MHRLARAYRRRPVLDELGPRIGENKILDALLRIIKDIRPERLGNVPPVLHTVMDGTHGALQLLLGAVGIGRRRRGLEGVKGGGGIDLALVAVQDPSRPLEDVLQFFEIL